MWSKCWATIGLTVLGVCSSISLGQVVVDNDDGAPAFVTSGAWSTSGSTGYDGGTYIFGVPGDASSATWTAAFADGGEHEVFVWYVPGSNRPTSAKYDVVASDGLHSVYINQQSGGYAWESLGTFTFNAGDNAITLDVAGSSGGTAIIADAVRFGGGGGPPIDPPTPVEVAQGVWHSVWELPTPNVLHVLEFDLADPRYDLQVGYAHAQRNYSGKEITTQIASRYESGSRDVIAAVNASHFDAGIFLHGMHGNGSNLIDFPTNTWPKEAYVLQESNKAFVVSRTPDAESVVRFADGAEMEANTFDYLCEAGTLAIWTTDWGPSTGSTSQGVEVIVEDVNYPWRPNKWLTGRITSIRTGAGSLDNDIPANGYVLGACSGMEAELLSHVSVGDEISARVILSPQQLVNSKVICGGASGWLVKDGAPYPENWNYGHAPVRHPRTALAWSGTKHWFVTCDGRQTGYSVGMTYTELADFLVDALGVDQAVNLDGGGSTTMVIDGDVVNCPSDGATLPCEGKQRAVPNIVMLIDREKVTSVPVLDEFSADGRVLGWDEKFTFNPVVAMSPANPSGDGYVMKVSNPEGGLETASIGELGDADYSFEVDVYCDYRPDVAADGFERVGIFARDDGNANFESGELGGGNCYALTYDSGDGRVRAGIVIDGVFTDYLESSPTYYTSSGWKRMRIDCYSETIRFAINGQVIASVSDGTHERGRCGIGYHEYFGDDGNIRGTRAERAYMFSFMPDYDGDGDVDEMDLRSLIFCLLGPEYTFPAGNYCLSGDADGDRNIDLLDFANLQSWYTGSR